MYEKSSHQLEICDASTTFTKMFLDIRLIPDAI